MPKRGENIYKRKDGRWEGRYIKQRHNGGKPQYGYIYGKTYSEVKEKIVKARAGLTRAGEPSSTPLYYKDIIRDWLSMARIRTKESTYSRYVYLADTHILPYLGEYTLDILTTQIIESHISFLLSAGRIDGGGGLSPKTVTDILVIIKETVNYARNIGIQPNCYLDGLTIKKPQPEMRVLTIEEHRQLVDVLLYNTDLPKFGVLLCLYTGIRVGEVCALKWENFDIDQGVLFIKETLQRIQDPEFKGGRKTKIIITEPKSRNSIRAIPLPEFLIEKSLEFKATPNSYILTGRHDRYMEPRLLQYHFKRYAFKCGLDDVNYHALRHTFATRCIEIGFDAKTLSEILGHTSVNLTLNRYVHSSLDIKRALKGSQSF